MDRSNTRMLGVTREQMLANVRSALGRRTTKPSPPPAVDEASVRLASASDDLPALFAQTADAVGMAVHRCAAADVVRVITDLLRTSSAKSVAVAAGSLPQAVNLQDTLRRQGFSVLDWRSSPGLDAQYDIDAGITDVHAALAETGTLICCADAGHSRGLSLVPPIHIAIVRHSDIVPDMLDYWVKLRRSGAPPASQVLITGPSKTSDIEGVLVTGVHGPTQVHVLLVRDA